MASTPGRTRAQRLAAAAAARSRFLEGSMNDRASAAPPVAFLGPAERAALERPVPGGGGGGDEDARRRLEMLRRRQRGRRPPARTRLGLVWEGVRGRLRMRRGPAGGDDGAGGGGGETKSASPSSSRAPPRPRRAGDTRHLPPPDAVDRPSREEVLASYHQLVSAGFFASHAIHSTRPRDQHRPGQPSRARPPPQPCSPPPPPPPPCPARRPPPPPPLASPVCSPASVASSRGTKRPAAASDDDDDDDDDDGDQREDGPGAPPEPPARPGHADDDASARARRLLPKRLRRSASRDMSLPKLRPPLPPVESAAEPVPRAPPRRLARLALPVNAPGCRASRAPPAARDDADAAPAASPRRPSGPRNLRPRIVGGPLRVVPDDNRGIPGVPAIPAKFARPEDRENHAGAAVESCP